MKVNDENDEYDQNLNDFEPSPKIVQAVERSYEVLIASKKGSKSLHTVIYRGSTKNLSSPIDE